jgi:hypothetical protein
MSYLVATPYLHLDNQTPASLDDALDDPFLIIRTKAEGPQVPMKWEKSWQIWAQLDCQATFPYSISETCCFAPFTIKEIGTIDIFAQHCFDHTKPLFFLRFQGEEPPHDLWWQISEDPEFSTIPTNLNVQIPYIDTIQLTDLQETFLNPGKTYYFRVCADHAPWSSTYAFQVQKPTRVQKVNFSKLDDQLYHLTWQPHSSAAVTYLIFASNALDFVPSIYLDEQLNALYGSEVLQKEAAHNLIYEISEPSLLIDGSYAYYRIIACHNGQLAIPSPIIYIYDHNLTPFRSCLKQDPVDPLLFKRQFLPSCYENEHQNPLAFVEKVSNYLYNPFVPQTLWQELKPYFLPINHPIKARLDRLFKKNRVIQSEETFEKAGFGKPKMRKPTQIVIGRNPHFKEYIFKVYLDTQPALPEWDNWVKRIEGARGIQACMHRHGFRHFSVPHKWIYPLPEEPSPPSTSLYHRKNFILIVDNMNILHSHDNLKAFKNKISHKLLEELYTILTEEGLIDSVYPDNIPFTKKGKIAFIDTEHHHCTPIPYDKLSHFLSPEMQKYWQFLIERAPHIK